MAKSPTALNNTGNTIPAGSAVFVSGFDPITSLPTMALADCRSSATMPAIGVVEQDVATGTTANVKASGVISYDTSLGSINGGVWVGFSGALIFTNPYTINSNYEAQQMGLIYTAGDITTGTINLIVLAIQQNTQSGSQQSVVVPAPATSDVTSVFGRTAAVVAQTNDYTWAQINKATSNIADITTKSHTSLTDIGTNTHSQIDSALSRLANTSGTNTGDQTIDGILPSQTGKSGDYLTTNGSSSSWAAVPAAAVTSVFGRTAAIVAASGDYDHQQLSSIGTNTHAQIDTALSRLANTSGTNTGDQTIPVTSVFGRTAAVVAASGDYTYDQLNFAGSNLSLYLIKRRSL